MFENLQEERLDNLQEDLVSCIEGEEGQGGKKNFNPLFAYLKFLFLQICTYENFLGDDQDLDDRVIKQLWEENQELRDQVHQMKSDYPQNDEGKMEIFLIKT